MVKSWADSAIEKLRAGENAVITPRGRSMTGLVEDGERVELHPVISSELKIGDIVLVRVKGNIYLHLIKAVHRSLQEETFLIGNNRGGLNGWVGPSAIYGIRVNK